MKPTRRRFESRLPQASTTPRLARLVIGLVLVLGCMYVAWQKSQERPAPEPVNSPAETQPTVETGLPRVRMEPERVIRTQVPNATIRDQDGEVVFRGTVDLRATLDRIERGERTGQGNDGSVFQNREKRLPSKPSGYYREWVHPTPDLRGPGPQRIVTGEDGEIYYTPDHYRTFERLDAREGTGGESYGAREGPGE